MNNTSTEEAQRECREMSGTPVPRLIMKLAMCQLGRVQVTHVTAERVPH